MALVIGQVSSCCLIMESTTPQSQNSSKNRVIDSGRIRSCSNCTEKIEQVCDKRRSCGYFCARMKKEQFHTTQCTRGSGHTRAPDKKSAAAVTPAAGTGGAAVTPVLQARPTEGRNTRTQRTAAESVADEKRHSRNERLRRRHRHPWSQRAISSLAKVPADERQNIEDMPSGSFNIAEQQTRIFQLCDVFVDGARKEHKTSWWNVHVRTFFCSQYMEPNEHKTSEAAALRWRLGECRLLRRTLLRCFPRSASLPERETLACGQSFRKTCARRSLAERGTASGLEFRRRTRRNFTT